MLVKQIKEKGIVTIFTNWSLVPLLVTCLLLNISYNSLCLISITNLLEYNNTIVSFDKALFLFLYYQEYIMHKSVVSLVPILCLILVTFVSYFTSKRKSLITKLHRLMLACRQLFITVYTGVPIYTYNSYNIIMRFGSFMHIITYSGNFIYVVNYVLDSQLTHKGNRFNVFNNYLLNIIND